MNRRQFVKTAGIGVVSLLGSTSLFAGEKEQQWIRCSDRLPEVGQKVLIRIKPWDELHNWGVLVNKVTIINVNDNHKDTIIFNVEVDFIFVCYAKEYTQYSANRHYCYTIGGLKNPEIESWVSPNDKKDIIYKDISDNSCGGTLFKYHKDYCYWLPIKNKLPNILPELPKYKINHRTFVSN